MDAIRAELTGPLDVRSAKERAEVTFSRQKRGSPGSSGRREGGPQAVNAVATGTAPSTDTRNVDTADEVAGCAAVLSLILPCCGVSSHTRAITY